MAVDLHRLFMSVEEYLSKRSMRMSHSHWEKSMNDDHHIAAEAMRIPSPLDARAHLWYNKASQL